MSFPFEHTKSDEAAGDMMQLRPLRACLTAGQAELILAHSNDFFYLGPEAIEPPDLRSRQHQTVGGIVLGAVPDDQDF